MLVWIVFSRKNDAGLSDEESLGIMKDCLAWQHQSRKVALAARAAASADGNGPFGSPMGLPLILSS